jgi:hypothetical protein
MASIASLLIKSCQLDATLGIPSSFAANADDAGERLTTWVTFTPLIACSNGMWSFLVLPPAPITPTRKLQTPLSASHTSVESASAAPLNNVHAAMKRVEVMRPIGLSSYRICRYTDDSSATGR